MPNTRQPAGKATYLSSPQATAAHVWSNIEMWETVEANSPMLSAVLDRALEEEQLPQFGPIRALLEQAFLIHIGCLREAVGMRSPPPEDDDAAHQSANGILLWDDLLYDYYESIGDTGGEAANALRLYASRRWESCVNVTLEPPTVVVDGARLWEGWTGLQEAIPPIDELLRRPGADKARNVQPSPVIHDFTAILLHDVVLPEFDSRHDRVWPAVTGVVVGAVEQIWEGNILFDAIDSDTKNNQETGNSGAVASPQLLACLQGIAGNRLVRYLVCETHRQWLAHAPHWRQVEIFGGIRHLADALDLGRRRDLRSLLDAGNRAIVQLPDGSVLHGLWTYRHRAGNQYGSGYLRINPAPELLPGAVQNIRRGSRERILIPVIPPHRDPPLVSAPRTWAAQLRLVALFLSELVAHPREVYVHQAARITERRWREMAEQAGVTHKTLNVVLSTWQSGTDVLPPILVRPWGDYWALAEAYSGEMGVIIRGAQDRIHAKKAGQKSAAMRRKRSHPLANSRKNPVITDS